GAITSSLGQTRGDDVQVASTFVNIAVAVTLAVVGACGLGAPTILLTPSQGAGIPLLSEASARTDTVTLSTGTAVVYEFVGGAVGVGVADTAAATVGGRTFQDELAVGGNGGGGGNGGNGLGSGSYIASGATVNVTGGAITYNLADGGSGEGGGSDGQGIGGGV